MSAMRIAVWIGVSVACVLSAFIYGRWLQSEERPLRPARISFIAASPDEFHQLAIAGARNAAEKLGAEVEFLVPASSHEQSSMIVGMNQEDIDGVAISPLSPRNQTRLLSRLATRVPVITYDNDAPESLRHCYIGTNNYLGGRLSAQVVKEVLPDGGKVAVFIGDTERDNARLRRLGFIDELLERPRSDEGLVDPTNQPLEGGGYTIVGTFLDEHNEVLCRKNVENALRDHDDLDVLVGLYGYVAPICLSVVQNLQLQDRIKIVGFDEHDATLRGIEQGSIAGTVVKDPYQYGYESIERLSSWSEDHFVQPSQGSSAPVLIPCRRIGPDNLQEYREQRDKHLVVAGQEQEQL